MTAGLSKAGLSIAGYGDAPTQTINPSKQIDYEARKVNPSTQDFIVDQHGNYQGCSGVEQMIYLAIRTAKGSSAVSNFGLDQTMKTLSGNTEARIRNLVQTALKDLVSKKLISILDIQVVRNRGLVHTKIIVKDLTTNKELRLNL